MGAYDDKSPLETAIDNGRLEIWNIMREGLELTDQEKLEQLCRMIVAGKMEQDEPWKEFKEFLSSLPLELVIIELYFGRGYILFCGHELFVFKTGCSILKELYQVSTTGVPAEGSIEEKRTLLQVGERFQETQRTVGF